MTAFNLGPLALPLALLPWLAGALVAWALAAWRRRRERPDAEPVLSWMLFSALLGARLAFVIRYADQYAGPVAMLDPRDGGFWWPGALAGALLGLALARWRGHGKAFPETGRALLAGALAAFFTTLVLAPLRPGATPVPDVTLHALSGEPVSLRQAAAGRVTLINLWASWCPPCRREMPVLEQAQRVYPAVRFLYANQGEGADTVRRYLSTEGLRLERVLLDPHRDLGRALGGGLPTTLLLDADGRLVNSHLGPLSAASLRHFLRPHLPPEPSEKE
ncbi:TlpA family protein disulfide reductase [Alloalcanivorax sp. C16-2]|uniref:TlpA family protein disulfide reductase n=1 Tax=Alloalcanivorax TaxID=3020832 RepID=UPI0019348314|nr:TlpA disulfide reductase family protein [Alloalcanivorax marinus]MBL7251172.1 TlpA family protein disulfide reductase [Alloalcanivorax marinus]